MKYRNLFIGLTICALSACAVKPYQHPADANSPILRFTNESGAKVAIMGYDDPVSCKGQLDLTQDHSRYLWISPGKPEAIKVRVDEPLSFLVSIRAYPGECFMAATLTPRKATEYAARIDTEGRVCKLTVGRMDNDKIVPDPAFFVRKYRMPFSGSQSACADSFVPVRDANASQ